MKKRFVAILLAVFLGSFGVHKFYLRRPGEGIFYIMANIFSRRLIGFNIAFILGIVDAVRLMMMDERAFDKKYNWQHMRKGYAETDTQKTDRQHRSRRRRSRTQPVKQRKRNNAAKRRGLKYLKNFDINEALEQYLLAAESDPNDGEVFFQLASIYSLLEKTPESLSNLQKALKLGYGKNQLFTEDKLAYVRIQPAFERFINNNYIYIPRNEDGASAQAMDLKEKVKQKRTS